MLHDAVRRDAMRPVSRPSEIVAWPIGSRSNHEEEEIEVKMRGKNEPKGKEERERRQRSRVVAREWTNGREGEKPKKAQEKLREAMEEKEKRLGG